MCNKRPLLTFQQRSDTFSKAKALAVYLSPEVDPVCYGQAVICIWYTVIYCDILWYTLVCYGQAVICIWFVVRFFTHGCSYH